MLSSLLEGWIQLEKARLNKLKADIKKEIKKAEKKAEEESKKEAKEKDKKSDSEKDKEISKKDAKKEAKKSNKVRALKIKEVALRAKIAVINALKIVVTVIEQFIMLLISILGPIGLLVILAVALLMLIIYGFLHLDFSTPDTTFYNPGVQNENCIQGNQAIANIGYDLSSMGQLQGTMTEYEKQLFQTLSLYNEILSKDPKNVFPDSSKLEKAKENVSVDTLSKFFFGFSAIETGLKFGNGEQDVYKYPSQQEKNGAGYAFLGLHYNNVFNGVYKYNGVDGRQVLIDSFVNEWKGKYTPSETPKYDNNFVPYGVATQTGTLVTSYLPNWDTVAEIVTPIMDEYGISANKNILITYCQMFASAACYHSGSLQEAENVYSLWCALWAATSTVDSERSFDKIEIIYNNAKDYTENSARSRILITNNFSGNYFKIGSEEITEPLWKWLKNRYADHTYFNSTANSWIDSHPSNIDGHYGLVAYLMGNRVVKSLGGTVPIVTGGSIDDCDCYEGLGGSGSVGGSGSFQDLNSIKAGEIQGDWPEDVKEKMMKYGWNQWFGRSYTVDNPNDKLPTNSKTWEEWRLESKWKVPYQHQNSGSSKEYFRSGFRYGKIHIGNCCHIFMSSYIASALTGKYINCMEMAAALRATGGMDGNGLSYNVAAYKTFSKLGIYYAGMTKNGTTIVGSNENECPIVYPSGNTIAEKINAVLDAGGIVGVTTEKGAYTSSGHYFVITEHNGDKYKTFSASTPSNDTSWHTLDFIIGANGSDLRTMKDNSSFYFAYKPNSSNSNASNVTTNNNSGVSDYLFIGDSFTKRIESVITSNNNQVVAAVGATPAQFEGITTQSTTIGSQTYAEEKGPLPKDVKGIVILLGANNTSQSSNMKNVLTELLNYYDSIPIYVQKVFPVGSGYSTIDAATMLSNINSYNDTIKTFCDSDPRLKFIDTTTGYVDTNGYLLHTSDNLHLDTSESNNWYSNIIKEIANAGGVSNNVGGTSYTVNCISKGTPTVAGTFQETPGQFQGSWGDLRPYIEQLPENRKNDLQGLVQYVGTKPINEGKDFYKYQQDKWVSYNGKGAVRYNQGHQGKNGKSEVWSMYQYNPSSDKTEGTFAYYACGSYSAAFAASTLLGKYINPPELMLAAMTYKIRNPDKFSQLNSAAQTALSNLVTGDTSKYTRYAITPVLNELGLDVTIGSFKIDEVDACLNNNGVVIVCASNGIGLGQYFTDEGHYIVIREKTDSGYLIYSSTHWNVEISSSDKIPKRADYVDRVFSVSEITGMFSFDIVNYVRPK